MLITELLYNPPGGTRQAFVELRWKRVPQERLDELLSRRSVLVQDVLLEPVELPVRLVERLLLFSADFLVPLIEERGADANSSEDEHHGKDL